MTERADYYVEKVHLTKERDRIIRVSVRQDNESKLSKPVNMARKQVLSNIQSGKQFMTIFRNENGKYRKGQKISSVHVNGEEFLRTDVVGINQDHLDGLPEF